MLYFRLRTL